MIDWIDSFINSFLNQSRVLVVSQEEEETVLYNTELTHEIHLFIPMTEQKFMSTQPFTGFLCACLLAVVVTIQVLTINPALLERNSFTTDIRGAKIRANVSSNNNDNDNSYSSNNSGAKCLSFENGFDDLVNASDNIFITMPAKSAGTAIKLFTKECVGFYDKSNTLVNFLNTHQIEDKIDNFVQKIYHPKIFSSHLYTARPMVEIVQNAPRNSLIIYVYREEHERMLSGLREVIQTSVCTNNVYPDISAAERNATRCVIDEMTIANKVLKEKKAELRFGSHKIMTCKFYNAIEQNLPRMIFIHYKEIDNMQRVLAKYHCPELLSKLPMHKNLKEQKKTEVFVKREKDGELTEFSEWVDAKHGMMEWTFELNTRNEDTCQAKTRQLEDELHSCKDGLLQVTRNTVF